MGIDLELKALWVRPASGNWWVSEDTCEGEQITSGLWSEPFVLEIGDSRKTGLLSVHRVQREYRQWIAQ